MDTGGFNETTVPHHSACFLLATWGCPTPSGHSCTVILGQRRQLFIGARTVREYLQTPGLGLEAGESLPGLQPRTSTRMKPIWGWAREEATGNLCLGRGKWRWCPGTGATE